MASSLNPILQSHDISRSRADLEEREALSKIRVENARLELEAKRQHLALTRRQASLVLKANEMMIREEQESRRAGCPPKDLQLLDLPTRGLFTAHDPASRGLTRCSLASEADTSSEKPDYLGNQAC